MQPLVGLVGMLKGEKFGNAMLKMSDLRRGIVGCSGFLIVSIEFCYDTSIIC